MVNTDIQKSITRDDLDRALRGHIEPVHKSILYYLSAVVVAITMVSLVAIYGGIILTLCGVLTWHAATNWRWVDLGVLQTAGYVLPIAVGMIVILMLIKPIFAPKPQSVEPRRLDPERHPLLFFAVQRISEVIGAPAPSEIHVSCEVNASAGFPSGATGILSGRLILTIGLPFIGALSVRELAGIIAHELGHFAQAKTMRMTYIVNLVDAWFERVVYERDSWDIKFDEWRSSDNFRWGLGLIAWMATPFVAGSRRLLKVLMKTGHFVSCFMARQHEYDADCYAARLVGYSLHEPSLIRTAVLSIAEQVAINSLNDAWTEAKVGDNIVQLVLAKEKEIPISVLSEARKEWLEEKTLWHSTHPSLTDRVQRVTEEAAPGIFQLEGQASQLCPDLEELSKELTADLIRVVLGEDIRPDQILTTEQILARQKEIDEEFQAVSRATLGGDIPTRPLLLAEKILPPVGLARGSEELREAREALLATGADARESKERLNSARDEWMKCKYASLLLQCGFGWSPVESELPPPNKVAINMKVKATKKKMEQERDILGEVELRARTRLERGLALLESAELVIRERELLREEVNDLLPVLHKLAPMLPKIADMQDQAFFANLLLNQYREAPKSVPLQNHLGNTLTELRNTLASMHESLYSHTYPFGHADGNISIAQFVMEKVPPESELVDALHAADDMVDKIYTLYYRLLGRIAQAVDDVEEAVGFKALPEPIKGEEEQAKPSSDSARAGEQ